MEAIYPYELLNAYIPIYTEMADIVGVVPFVIRRPDLAQHLVGGSSMTASNKLHGHGTWKGIAVKKAVSDVAVETVGGNVNKNCKMTLGHTVMEPPTYASTRGTRRYMSGPIRKNIITVKAYRGESVEGVLALDGRPMWTIGIRIPV
jgi:hypothetical protein